MVDVNFINMFLIWKYNFQSVIFLSFQGSPRDAKELNQGYIWVSQECPREFPGVA